jgi:hypothetical protein
MNERLLRAWEKGQQPFHGNTLSAENLTFEQIAECSCAVMLGLEQSFASDQFCKLDDWHEHDDYLTEAAPISLNEIEAAFASAAVLNQFCPGETGVCAAIYPQSAEFLWRIGVDESSNDRTPACHSGDGHRWRFDFSASDPHLVDVKTLLTSVQYIDVNVAPTIEFFDRNSTGRHSKHRLKQSRNARLPSRK